MDSNIDLEMGNGFPYLPEDHQELPTGQRIYPKFGDDVVLNNGPTGFEVNGLHGLDAKNHKIYAEVAVKDEIVIAKTKQLIDDMSSGSEIENEDDENDQVEKVKEDHPYYYWHLFRESLKTPLKRRYPMKRRKNRSINKTTEVSSKLSALSIRRRNETAAEKRERKKAFKQCRKEFSDTKREDEGTGMKEQGTEHLKEIFLYHLERYISLGQEMIDE